MKSFVVSYINESGKVEPICEYGVFKILPSELSAKREMEVIRKSLNQLLNGNKFQLKEYIISDLTRKLKSIHIKQIEYNLL